jgi:outer membrane protein insertion porin family
VAPQDGHQTLGFRVQTTFLSGYAGRVAPPFERFFLGGENDLRGFDTRAVTPYAFITNGVNFTLTNPDGTPVPVDPNNPRRGNVVIPLPVKQVVLVGGDSSVVANLEYRIPIAGPVTLAPFMDFGLNMITRGSQLRLSDVNINQLNATPFGCPAIDPTTFTCTGTTSLSFAPQLGTVAGTNYTPRMSTGMEVQVILPIVNAPFRIYWAYNPLRLNTFNANPTAITREMFPPGGAGDFSYRQALAAFAPDFQFREPVKTFRFTVSTTF